MWQLEDEEFVRQFPELPRVVQLKERHPFPREDRVVFHEHGHSYTVDGQRVKDDGILEKFDVSLAEAQDLVMTARVMLGWVDPEELVGDSAEETETEESEAEE